MAVAQQRLGVHEGRPVREARLGTLHARGAQPPSAALWAAAQGRQLPGRRNGAAATARQSERSSSGTSVRMIL